jgi:PAS domain S-box-containing protein
MSGNRDSKDLFKKVFQGTPYGMLIVDRFGYCMNANPSATRLLGITKKQLLSRKISDLLIPNQKSDSKRIWNEVLSKPAKEFDFRLARSDGKTVDIGITAKPGFYRANHLLVLHDITIRKHAEIAMRKQSQMLDFANDTIMIRDLNDTISYWNQGAERLYGWSRKEAIGQNVHTFLNTKFPSPLEEVLKKCIQEGHWEGVLIHCKKDRSLVTVSSRWTLQRNELGEPSAFLEINNDITERVNAEEALKRANDELERRVVERTAELSKANARLKALSARLISAQEEERWRISRDLHDDLGQILTSISLDLQRALQLSEPARSKILVERVLNANLEARNRLRELSSLLRPRVLDDVGLKEAIQTYVSEFEARTGVRCEVMLGCRNSDFNDGASTNIYRILQEALTNVSRHARARKVSVQLEVSNGNAMLKIKDNGVGFNPNSIKMDKAFGLLGMRERTNLLGGEFIIQSSSGAGTKLSISFPIIPKQKAPGMEVVG